MIVPIDSDALQCIIGYCHWLCSFVRCELSMFDFLIGIDQSHHSNDQHCIVMHYPIFPLQMIVPIDPDALQRITGYFDFKWPFQTRETRRYTLLGISIDSFHS